MKSVPLEIKKIRFLWECFFFFKMEFLTNHLKWRCVLCVA